MGALTAAWKWLQQGTLVLPTQARIDDAHVHGAAEQLPLEANGCYFAVHIKELYLHDRRTWWQTHVPSVWTSTAFSYAGAAHDVPNLIGPSMLSGNELGAPQGMLYRNTRVAGLHPYKGGPLSFSVVLNRISSSNPADQVLSLVESTRAAFDLATGLAPYLTIARTVTQGLEVLLGMGSQPVMGVRDTMAPDVAGATSFRPGHYALLDQADPAIHQTRLWVRDDGLHVGESMDSATPVRDRNYLLYSILTVDRRNDVDQIAGLSEMWRRVEEFAQRPGDDNWFTAQSAMTELGISLSSHPDLIRPQAEELYSAYVEEMVRLRDRRVQNAQRGMKGPGAQLPPLDEAQLDMQAIAHQIRGL
jgi:hypothetical protein